MARFLRPLAASMGAAALGGALSALSGARTAFGGRPDDAVLLSSPQFHSGAFRNSAPPRRVPRGSNLELMGALLRDRRSRRPGGAVPLVGPSGPAPADGLYITWYGHSSSLVEADGARVLLDPVWSDCVAPSRAVGPKRLHAVPHRLADLPPVDAIAISHDHYDHLDMPTVRALCRGQSAPFVVPLGVGAHLRAWGVPDERIVELDWGEGTTVGKLRLVATPAQHFSGRALARNNTLWASWVIVGRRHRVFYSGDTGYFDGFRTIGEQYGPFDTTLIQIGAYAALWPDIHMTPEEGVAAHRDVRGGLLIPVHWATFNLAPHSWSDPVDRVWDAALAQDIALAIPRPGERVAAAAPPEVCGWWQTVAAEAA